MTDFAAAPGDRRWPADARWIAAPAERGSWHHPVMPAPFFRRAFVLPDPVPADARAYVCGLGFYELYVNGEKVGDAVLDPPPGQFDRRAPYRVHDLSGLLRPGGNAVGVLLGCGGYDTHTAEVWHFDKAPWRDYPKFLFALELDGRPALVSDAAWSCRDDGPIRFDQLRNGEHYDARRERPDWATPGFVEDGDWQPARIKPGPGGDLTRLRMPPCRVTRTIPAALAEMADGAVIADLGENIAGWARIAVRGPAGSSVTLAYAERLDPATGGIDARHIGQFIQAGDFQTDRYTLRGDEAGEAWEPRFSYHGFQYVRATAEGGARLVRLDGRVVHTDFAATGRFDADDPVLPRLWAATRNAYVSNFVGLPTDCPHREKNAWTGDAALAAETGLFLFDAADSYRDWLRTLADGQRPNGQLPAIAPTAGWGYNWGSGPVWDSAFWLIPWYLHVYADDRRCFAEHGDAMRRHLDYVGTLTDRQGIVRFGLGDWCAPDSATPTPPELATTAFYFLEADVLSRAAALMGRQREAEDLAGLARRVRDDFHAYFYAGDGRYADGSPTASALALVLGLCPDGERPAVARALVERVRAAGHRAEFGILGAKYVPRALADAGHIDDAFAVLTQRACPGWAHWLDQSATTLWENWDGHASRNHIMFGDVAAWMTTYLAGLTPDPSAPGFARPVLRPRMPSGLAGASARQRLPALPRAGVPAGELRIGWRRGNGGWRVEGEIPPGRPSVLILPGQAPRALPPGHFEADGSD